MQVRLVAVIGVWIGSLGGPTFAGPSDLCLTASRVAAAESGVPLAVLLAITQTETGRSEDGVTRPWPWAVNMEGAGHWFDDRQEALSFVEARYQSGARNFDVGCFQINYRWHGEQFASPAAMFDPTENARYAARFLSELYAELGNWSEAAGAYHSRTQEHAARYRLRFDEFLADAVAYAETSGPLLPAVPAAVVRENTFPLLQPAGGSTTLGSLVPIGPAR